ncbi:MAG: hypothetical protein ACK5OW_01465 [bacterium]
MKIKLSILFFLFSLINSVKSQVSTWYTFSETVGTYTAITGGTQLVTTTAGAITYDTDGNNIVLPTTSRFVVNGIIITNVNMTADGSLWCNPVTPTSGFGTTGPLQSGQDAAGIISVMGMDLRSTALATQVYERRWQDVGTEVVFQWQNCARYLQSGTERFSFQIRINKTNNQIRMVYGNMTTIANSTTYQPQVGIRGLTNADYIARRLTNSVPDASPNWGAPNGTTNATTNAHTVRFTSNGSCFPVSGLTFIWSYSGPLFNNDLCENATLVTLPYNSGVVTTIGSSTDVPNVASPCDDYITQSNNLWYRVVGTGNDMTFNTCNASTNFDSEIRVYTGDCSSLNSMVEVVCSDDDPNCTSGGVLDPSVTWCSSLGVNYFISVGYYTVTSTLGTGNYVLSGVEGGSCSSLPVELIHFSGKGFEHYNLLRWKTATEINNDHFTLERSLDGIRFQEIQQIDGMGNSNVIQEYSTRDFELNTGLIYYRLIQTDYDGTRTYSDIIVINRDPYKSLKVVRITNVLGQDINEWSPGIKLYHYSDGSIEKRIE